jgi:hypothetical protein
MSGSPDRNRHFVGITFKIPTPPFNPSMILLQILIRFTNKRQIQKRSSFRIPWRSTNQL